MTKSETKEETFTKNCLNAVMVSGLENHDERLAREAAVFARKGRHA